MTSPTTDARPTSRRKVQRVYLDGLIREYQNEGFRTGLVVARDGCMDLIWFDGSEVQSSLSLPIEAQAKQARHDAKCIRDAHYAAMGTEDA